MSPTPSPLPSRVTVRMYQVGFGDCFLISFNYAKALSDGRRQRHVLIDCGTTREAPGTTMAEVAQLVSSHTEGKLDVLVITHRHKDHLSGFSAKASAQILESLSPSLVVRPWTEKPTVASDATSLDDRSRRFAAGLEEAQRFAAGLGAAMVGATGARGDLMAAALDQVSNKVAIDRIDALAAAGRSRYLHYGMPSGIDALVPGLVVRVLGPPTVKQWPAVASQRADDPEYWLTQSSLLARALGAAGVQRRVAEDLARATRSAPGDPGPARWLVTRMADRHVASLQRIVRSLDDALNNTSLILLLDVGDRRMLFGGDAQIENWSYALRHARGAKANRELLADVELYKVGHHGSRNGTPRSLVGLWQPGRGRTALLSTLPGVHGKTAATRVPRATLVSGLERVADLVRTDGFAASQRFVEVRATPSGRGGFRLVENDK